MITYRQFVILGTIKNNSSNMLGLYDLKKILKSKKANSKKYSDDILRAELKELKDNEFVRYTFADNTIFWLAITTKGSVAVDEFWKTWLSQKAKVLGSFLIKEAIVPIIVSIITAIITTKLCLGGTP